MLRNQIVGGRVLGERPSRCPPAAAGWHDLLSALQLLRRIFLYLQVSSTGLEHTNTQSPRLQTGRKTQDSAHKVPTRTQHTRHSLGVKETNTVIQADTTFDHDAATLNLSHYWLASNLMTARRSSPISSLVPAVQSAQGTATGPRRNLAHWYQCCPMPSQCPWKPQETLPKFPQLLPPLRKFLSTETKLC